MSCNQSACTPTIGTWSNQCIINVSSLYQHLIIHVSSIISSMYHHCIINISSMYHHYIIIISSLYHTCIINNIINVPSLYYHCIVIIISLYHCIITVSFNIYKWYLLVATEEWCTFMGANFSNWWIVGFLLTCGDVISWTCQFSVSVK